MVNICDKVSTFEAVHALAMAHDDIWCTVGTHPHEAKEDPDLDRRRPGRAGGRPEGGRHRRDAAWTSTTTSARATSRPRCSAPTCAAARETGLPLVVHTREADEVMGEILRGGARRGPVPAPDALLHLRRRNWRALAAALGAWFSVSGIATFKAAEDVRAVIRDMPADRIIVETDCPYLAPVPHRGPAQRAGLYRPRPGQAGRDPRLEPGRGRARTDGRLLRPVRPDPAAMSGTLEFTILGCGSSGGVPRGRRRLGRLRSRPSPKNRRTRCSLLVRRLRGRGRRRRPRVLIDTSPDLRDADCRTPA